MVSKNYVNWILSLLYALIYVYAIPWTDFIGREFVDIHAYLARIVYLQEGGKEATYFGIKWLMSEPLWKLVIVFIGDVFTDYRAVLYFISFLTIFFYVSFLIRHVEFYVAMLFLLTPMMVDMFLAQIRIAVAFSLVLVAYDIYIKDTSKKTLVIILLIMAVLIHISMPVFYGIYYLLYRLNLKVEDKKYYLIAIFTALFIALFMKFGSNALLTFLGDRHAGYDEYISGSSISYSITWFIIAIIIGTFGDFSDNKKRILVAYAITILSFFFFASILNIFAARYVAVTMPITIVAISFLPKHFKQGTYLSLFFYNLYSFKYWLQLTIL
ncbi:MAG: Unknown protein [uncultured Sulfurovum sp.]|uniref:EpsG family protein n=1 Tax=uncultured Sulfurovum sp. TaxID=269237 RepID=A0A6S6TA00_9BACT|nr:MAG: Unknown protein [uncultured Sulfurovum sp.]